MEEEEEHTSTMSPFWLPNSDHHHHHHRLRRSYSLLLTSTSLLVLLLVTSLAFAFIVVPTLHSFASHIFKPHTVKKSWDTLNLVLVLFAIVCGFLSKHNETTASTTRSHEAEEEDRNRSFSNPKWDDLEYSDSTPYYRSFSRLRSFNSYPDLRHVSPWVAHDQRWRFHDDTYLLRRPSPEEEGMEIKMKVATAPPETRTEGVRRNAKRIDRETVIEKPSTTPPPPPPPEQPPPATPTEGVRRNVRRTYKEKVIEKPSPQPEEPPPATSTEGVRGNVKRRYREEVIVKPSTPPPPPPVPVEWKTVEGKKKRGYATKEFLTSLRGKKKKQRQRSVEYFDTILNSETFSVPSQPPPPPPPPPPPFFHNLFSSKKGKHKKRQLDAPTVSRSKLSDEGVATTHEQGLLNKREGYYGLQDKVMITGNESPLIPIPPPPPPFNLPAWKFKVQGDFVRIDSIGSSRSGSPDLDEVVDSPIGKDQAASQCSSTSPYAPYVGESGITIAPVSAASLFCPSPDVDTKANTFIERFRAGLRMEKMNSMKEKQGVGVRRSNLGPSPNTTKQRRN